MSVIIRRISRLLHRTKCKTLRSWLLPVSPLDLIQSFWTFLWTDLLSSLHMHGISENSCKNVTSFFILSSSGVSCTRYKMESPARNNPLQPSHLQKHEILDDLRCHVAVVTFNIHRLSISFKIIFASGKSKSIEPLLSVFLSKCVTVLSSVQTSGSDHDIVRILPHPDPQNLFLHWYSSCVHPHLPQFLQSGDRLHFPSHQWS